MIDADIFRNKSGVTSAKGVGSSPTVICKDSSKSTILARWMIL